MDTPLTAGIHTLTATFYPTDKIKYRVTNIERKVGNIFTFFWILQAMIIHNSNIIIIVSQLIVKQAVTVLVWPRPIALAEGDLIDKFILNCTNLYNKKEVLPGESTMLLWCGVSHSSWLCVDLFFIIFQWDLSHWWTVDTISVFLIIDIWLSGWLSVISPNHLGTYTYDPPAGTALPKGLHPLSVVFRPTDEINYAEVTTTIQFRVLPKRTPTLYWPQPFELTHPAPLTNAQLSANVSGAIKGDWKFTPDFGTILDAGVHTLSATFYPAKWAYLRLFSYLILTFLWITGQVFWSHLSQRL